ncbi:MAG TPA: response regulator, partial [Geminicoccaceae bacterium]|nr:response regulator [Geminicoccaceae bacterium]
MSGDDFASPAKGLAEEAARAKLGGWPAAGASPAVIQLGPHRRPAPHAGEPERAGGGEAGPAIRVLVVDGHEEDFLIVRDLLGRAEEGPFVVEHAPNPESGLGRLLAGSHDVGLVDYRLADGDGLSFARLAVRRGVRVPLILVSGIAVPDLEIEAIESGAADFLDK